MGHTKSAVAPKLGQLASGIDSDILKYMSGNLDKIRAAETSGTSGAEIYTELRDQIQDQVKGRLDEAGEKLVVAGGDKGISASVKEVEAPILDLIKKYEFKANKAYQKFGEAAADLSLIHI